MKAEDAIATLRDYSWFSVKARDELIALIRAQAKVCEIARNEPVFTDRINIALDELRKVEGE
jgi:hypothetical protein